MSFSSVFPFSLPGWLYTGSIGPLAVRADWATSLALDPPTYGLSILAEDTGNSTAGLYVYAGNRWIFCLPYDVVTDFVINGGEVYLYYDLDATSTTPANAVVYRMGVLVADTSVPADSMTVWVAVVPQAAAGGGGSGVQSVGLTAPNIFSVTGSPVTSIGQLALSLNSQSTGQVFAAPANNAGVPSFRTLAATDLPIATGSSLGVVQAGAGLSITNGILSAEASSPANPTGTVGPSAVNGIANTYMRSDAAPAINLGAAYAWTGAHSFAERPTFNGATPWDKNNLPDPVTGPGSSTDQTIAIWSGTTGQVLTGGTSTSNLAFIASPNAFTATQTILNNNRQQTGLHVNSGGLLMNLFVDPTLDGGQGAYGIISETTGNSSLTFNGETDVGAFFARPTFAGNTPWDSGNLNPATFVTANNPVFTGTATVDGNYVTVNGASGSIQRYTTNTSGSPTWEWGTDGTPQTGANSGSNWNLWAFSDSAISLYPAISITRSTGATALYARPTFNGNLAWDAGNFNPANYLPLAGGALTGTVTNSATQPAVTDSSTKVPTTAWVQGAITNATTGGTNNPTFTGTTTVQNLIATGTVTLTNRPTFAGNTPWDSGNFNPANYAPLAGATFTGAVEFNGNTEFANEAQFNAPATFTSVGATSFATRPTFNSATPWDSANFTPSNYLTTAAAATTYVPLEGVVTMSGIYTFANSPQVPTATSGDNSDAAASTAFVQAQAGTGIGMPIVIDKSYEGPNPAPLLTANQIVFANLSPRSIYLVPVYTQFLCLVNPSTDVVFTVELDGAVIGTMTLSSAAVATWSLPGNQANNLPVARGQQLRIIAPASPDGLLAGLSISMGGYTTSSLGHS
jgi:hypothetical protein